MHDTTTPPSPAPRPSDTARRRRTRERLMDAAYRLFTEHGVHATPIEAVAEAAGFTRGAFYSNFDSKTELFFALADRENAGRLAHLRDAVDRLRPPAAAVGQGLDEETLAEVIAGVVAAQPEDRRWYLLHREFELLAMRDPDVAPRFLAHEQAFRHALADLLDAGVRSLGLRFVLEPVELTRLVVAHYEAAVREAILAGSPDGGTAARSTVMRSLPALVHRLTEPLPG